MLGLDHAGVADNHGALDRVAQFADIARPGIIVELIEHRFADCGDFADVFVAHLGQQKLHQSGNVFFVFAQRRHVDVEYVEPVIEIAAQLAASHGLVGNLVGRGEDAHIDRGLDLASQTAQFVIFQDAQQLGLGSDRHLADFIQQQRAAFSQFEAAGAAFQSAGEMRLFRGRRFRSPSGSRESRRS